MMVDIFKDLSEIRNPAVANIFKNLGLKEQGGSGIDDIIRSC